MNGQQAENAICSGLRPVLSGYYDNLIQQIQCPNSKGMPIIPIFVIRLSAWPFFLFSRLSRLCLLDALSKFQISGLSESADFNFVNKRRYD